MIDRTPRADSLNETETARLLQRQDMMHLVAWSGRPGALALISTIEWFYFSPRKGLNHLFEMLFVKWEDTLWNVASFPKWKAKAVKELAPQLGMRIADGAPTMIRPMKPGEKAYRTVEGIELAPGMGAFYFPGAVMPDGRNNYCLFQIENDKDSPVYKNCRKSDRDILSAEREVCDGFINGVEWTTEMIVDYVYGVPNFVAEKKKQRPKGMKT